MICPHCGEDLLLSLEVYGHEWQPLLCCERLQAELEGASPAEWRALLVALTDGGLGERGLLDDCRIDYRLRVDVVRGPAAWRRAVSLVSGHHRHHPPPRGWKFGIECHNGPTLVGVAMVGRTVARMLPRDWLEVNRSCTRELSGLERHAASMLYAAAAREARRVGMRRIITYTLASESGVSLTAAGWTRVAHVRGRSWSCRSRPRVDKAPTCDKYRWERGL